MTLPPDSKEFIALLNAANVEYVIAGAHPMSFYGVSRATGDLDVAVRMSDANAGRICGVFAEIGFGNLGFKREDFLVPGNIIQLGRPPNRIDILTSLDGVISRAHLNVNKRATGRPRDLDDVQQLES